MIDVWLYYPAIRATDPIKAWAKGQARETRAQIIVESAEIVGDNPRRIQLGRMPLRFWKESGRRVGGTDTTWRLRSLQSTHQQRTGHKGNEQSN